MNPPSSSSYQVFPFYSGADTACPNNNAVYLIPPSPPATYKQSVPLTIQFLYTGDANYKNYTYNNPDFGFSLSQQGSGQPTQANIITSIQINGTTGNMWKCAPSARAALMSNFTDFLQNIESQFELQGVLIPGAAFRIGQQIADYMPAPLLETLFYRYSVSPGTTSGTVPYVDIRPGMRLRVETQSSQFLTPGSSLNGYVGTGNFSYFVNSAPAAGGARVIVFDPFLGIIKAPSITSASTAPVVAGGLIDLAPIAGARTYWRLFYPQSMAAPSQPGDLTTQDNVTLIGAQTLEYLNAATNAYPHCNAEDAPPNICAIFLGRTIVVPEIPVWVNLNTLTTLEYVPVGTTFANIIERFTMPPLSSATTSFSVQRPMTTGNPLNITLYNGLTPAGNPMVAYPSTMFDVPLIAGDRVNIPV